MFDLTVLVADKNMEAAVRGLLSRPQSLNIREITARIHVHMERDPGCFGRGHDFLRPMARSYSHAILMFDRDGSGVKDQTREQLETSVETRLSGSGWEGRAAAIVLDPELEVWVWSDSPEVEACLGWTMEEPRLQPWLREKGLWPENVRKPPDPKRALETAIREVRVPRSSSIYHELATRVGFRRCGDPAFLKLTNTLQRWFPVDAGR